MVGPWLGVTMQLIPASRWRKYFIFLWHKITIFGNLVTDRALFHHHTLAEHCLGPWLWSTQKFCLVTAVIVSNLSAVTTYLENVKSRGI